MCPLVVVQGCDACRFGWWWEVIMKFCEATGVQSLFFYASFLLERIFLKTETLFISVSTVVLTPRSALNNEYVALH